MRHRCTEAGFDIDAICWALLELVLGEDVPRENCALSRRWMRDTAMTPGWLTSCAPQRHRVSMGPFGEGVSPRGEVGFVRATAATAAGLTVTGRAVCVVFSLVLAVSDAVCALALRAIFLGFKEYVRHILAFVLAVARDGASRRLLVAVFRFVCQPAPTRPLHLLQASVDVV